MGDQRSRADLFLRSGVLLSLVFLLVILLAGGTMRILLHPDLLIWQWISAGVLLLFSIIEMFVERPAAGRTSRWVSFVFLVPVALAVAAPPTILGADVFDRHGYTMAEPVAPSAALGREVNWLIDDTIIIDDENFFEVIVTLRQHPHEFLGYQLEMVGFTVPGRTLFDDQTMIARLLMICHAACSIPEGIIAQSADLAQLPDDVWVSVRGTLRLAAADGREQLVLNVTSYTELTAKRDPYVFIR